MRKISWLLVTLLICFPTLALAAGAIDGGSKQAVNWAAIGMFIGFVILDPCHNLLGVKAHGIGCGFLLRRRWNHRLARTASRSPAITCRRPRSWAFRALSTPPATMV